MLGLTCVTLRKRLELALTAGMKTDPALRARLNYELGVIGKMGFDTYFLIVWDLREFARETAHLVECARFGRRERRGVLPWHNQHRPDPDQPAV